MYNDMMLLGRVSRRHNFLKLKIPFKIKIFLWYLEKGVTLTKDDLIKRNRKGEGRCCFYYFKETIQHPFYCHIEKFVWNSLFYAFGLQPPSTVSELLGSWKTNFSWYCSFMLGYLAN